MRLWYEDLGLLTVIKRIVSGVSEALAGAGNCIVYTTAHPTPSGCMIPELTLSTYSVVTGSDVSKSCFVTSIRSAVFPFDKMHVFCGETHPLRPDIGNKAFLCPINFPNPSLPFPRNQDFTPTPVKLYDMSTTTYKIVVFGGDYCGPEV